MTSVMNFTANAALRESSACTGILVGDPSKSRPSQRFLPFYPDKGFWGVFPDMLIGSKAVDANKIRSSVFNSFE